jgi:hypothetical protein
MQARANLKRIGVDVPLFPETGYGIETAMQLRLLCEQLYTLFEEAQKKGLGYLLPVAFRMLHEARMSVGRPPTFMDLLDDLKGQELLDFEHAGKLIFGDEPEPDIDEPTDEDEDDEEPF